MKLLEIIRNAAFKENNDLTHQVMRFEMATHHASIRSEVLEVGEDYVVVKDSLGKGIYLNIVNIVSVSFVDTL